MKNKKNKVVLNRRNEFLKRKKKTKLNIYIIIIYLFSINLRAQSLLPLLLKDPPPFSNEPPPPGAPINSNLWILISIGVYYGVKKIIFDKKSSVSIDSFKTE